ncbi:MAG: spondin domain-containing protein [Xenococcaceae cyanobacterium MO_167.B27]|nr:spondin domain-containing protein [Xenococcaceae cyanobacterium MO_167.B27]
MDNSFPQNSVPSESNITLEIKVENLAPENGAFITPVWFGLHDGSFDTFDVGEDASSGVMYLAQDGLTGNEGSVPGVVEAVIDLGLNPDVLPPEENTIAGIFANSSAAANGGTQGVVISPDLPLGLFPGQSLSVTVDIDSNNLDNNRFFNYGAMYFPSNDAFVANDDAIELFDAFGNFIAEDIIITGDDVWDAGTEVNDESPNNVPFTFDEIGNGIEENGTVQPHPGFLPPGSGGVLDFNDGVFGNADFTASDDPIFRISINPVINGSSESDLLFGTSNREKIRGFEGDDQILAGAGDDTVEGGAGRDHILGNRGDDYLLGNRGRDVILGGAGDDTVEGGAGRDQILGNRGDDYLLGNRGRDVILGGAGDDLIDGGKGNDRISGNSGADQFVLRLGDGRDTILDYQDNVDSFALADGLEFEQLTITQGVGEAVISVTETNEELAVIFGANADNITVEDFTNLV